MLAHHPPNKLCVEKIMVISLLVSLFSSLVIRIAVIKWGYIVLWWWQVKRKDNVKWWIRTNDGEVMLVVGNDETRLVSNYYTCIVGIGFNKGSKFSRVMIKERLLFLSSNQSSVSSWGFLIWPINTVFNEFMLQLVFLFNC